MVDTETNPVYFILAAFPQELLEMKDGEAAARRERAVAVISAIEAAKHIRFAVGSVETGFSGTWIA